MKKRFLMYVVLSLYLTAQLIAYVDQHYGIFFLEAFDLGGRPFGEGIVMPLPFEDQVEFDHDPWPGFHHSGDFEIQAIPVGDPAEEVNPANPREIIEGGLMRGRVPSEILGRLGIDEVPDSEEGCLRRLADYILEYEIYDIREVLNNPEHILGPDSPSIIGSRLRNVILGMRLE